MKAMDFLGFMSNLTHSLKSKKDNLAFLVENEENIDES